MDDLWYSEYHTPNVRFSIKVREQLHFEQSKYQKISVFDSVEFGRFLTLDGVVMLTERDEFIYHEMIAHVPMAVKPDAKRVLLIGGGDGGAARELCKYRSIERIDVVLAVRGDFNDIAAQRPRNGRIFALGVDDDNVVVGGQRDVCDGIFHCHGFARTGHA